MPNPALEILRAWCSEISEVEESQTMQCPYCSVEIAETWNYLYNINNSRGQNLKEPSLMVTKQAKLGESKTTTIQLLWMQCPNPKCFELIVKVSKVISKPIGDNQSSTEREEWFAAPKAKSLPTVDPLISENFSTDYLEAWKILGDSPRMSSVLSRRILADLLEQYAHLDHYNLASRIDSFIADQKHPSRLRENLHYLREMGDFSAHTQTDSEQKVIDVTPEEAQWTLKVVADLFDYFIIGPAKDSSLRTAFDKKLELAGRKPIKKLEPPKVESWTDENK